MLLQLRSPQNFIEIFSRYSQLLYKTHTRENRFSSLPIGFFHISILGLFLPPLIRISSDQHGTHIGPTWVQHGSLLDPCWVQHGSMLDPYGSNMGTKGTIVAVVSDQVERCHQSKREIPNVMCKHYVKVGPSSTSVPWPQGNAQKSLSENALWPGTPTKPKIELFQRTLPLKNDLQKN